MPATVLTKALPAILLIALPACADDWPQFRGAGGQSVSETVDPPVTWSVDTGAGIAWSADLPGNGVSSPIVVGGRVIVTAASRPDNDRLHVLAFDSMTGRPLWHRQFWATGRTACYRTSSVAAPTPATDGERVYAFYSSNDLVCLDLDGNLQWIRGLTLDHPGLGNDIGMASSPVVAEGVVIVQCECQTSAFAAGFDAVSGGSRWEADRPKDSNWTSPVVVNYPGAKLTPAGVLLQGREGLTLLGVETGSPIWQDAFDGATIASPMASDGLVVAAADGLSAFRRTAEGMEVVWRNSAVRPGSPSPVVYAGKVFTIGRGGVLAAVDVETGETAMKKRRLGGAVWATPVAAAGRLYCINQDGEAFVVDAAGDGQILGKSEFGAEIYGSPAAADGGLFVRSNEKLWKIATINQARRAAPDAHQ